MRGILRNFNSIYSLRDPLEHDFKKVEIPASYENYIKRGYHLILK